MNEVFGTAVYTFVGCMAFGGTNFALAQGLVYSILEASSDGYVFIISDLVTRPNMYMYVHNMYGTILI